MIERFTAASPQRAARIAGLFYLLVFVTGGLALTVRGTVGATAGLVAGACYVVVTVMFYVLFKPVNRTVSLIAAVVSLVGIVSGPAGVTSVNPLVFFGFYCALIGYLVLESTFLPRPLGALMLLASVGWLTFFWPPLSRSLYPYNLGPGLIGEGALTLWLVAVGVNTPAWLAAFRAASQAASLERSASIAQ